MEPVRLDPADPIGSVLAWLAALAQALGLDPSRPAHKIQLNQAAAAVVRGWLADWSRQLGGIVRAQAARLALSPPFKGLRFKRLRLKRRAAAFHLAGPAASSAAPPAIRFVALAAPARRLPIPSGATRPPVRPDPAELLDPVDQDALRRRTRAVLAALIDPGAAARRLARRLALLRARAHAARTAALRERLRFPHPPRALGNAPRTLAHAPEPRPPDDQRSVCGLQHAPWFSAAASPALAGPQLP